MNNVKSIKYKFKNDECLNNCYEGGSDISNEHINKLKSELYNILHDPELLIDPLVKAFAEERYNEEIFKIHCVEKDDIIKRMFHLEYFIYKVFKSSKNCKNRINFNNIQ